MILPLYHSILQTPECWVFYFNTSVVNIFNKIDWENETDRRAETFSQISQHYSQPVRRLFPKARANVKGISRYVVNSMPPHLCMEYLRSWPRICSRSP